MRGVPVLQYDGLGTSLPVGVDGRLANHWVAPVSLSRHLVSIRERGYRVVRLYDAWAPLDDGERRGKRALVLGEPILRGRDVASHDAADQGGDRDCERTDRKKPRASHRSMLTNNPCTSNDFRGVSGVRLP